MTPSLLEYCPVYCQTASCQLFKLFIEKYKLNVLIGVYVSDHVIRGMYHMIHDVDHVIYNVNHVIYDVDRATCRSDIKKGQDDKLYVVCYSLSHELPDVLL